MHILLDTQLLLWAASAPKRIPGKLRTQLEDAKNIPVFSAASLWEVSVKNALGRRNFSVNVALLRRGLIDNGWDELPITGSHAIATGLLPTIHQDPFDRILLAQAEVEGFVMYTTDKTLTRYPVPVRLVAQ